MPELTDAELAELSERLKAGDPKAIGPALRALPKPQRKVVPEVHQPNGLTLEADTLAHLRRDLTKLSAIHARIMEGRRYIDALRQKGGNSAVFSDKQAADFFGVLPSLETQLHAVLEAFLHSLRLRIGKPK